jgi:hypothetical protein
MPEAIEQPPGSPITTAQVRQAWQQILGHSDFRDDESFFRIGGHSLRALKLIRLLGELTGVRLNQRLIFDNSTVNSLTAALHAHVDTTQAPAPSDSPDR